MVTIAWGSCANADFGSMALVLIHASHQEVRHLRPLEAMKMEAMLTAERDAVLKTVRVKRGDVIAAK